MNKMMLMKFIFSFIATAFISSGLTHAVSAQNRSLPIQYSFRDGAYLYFADKAITKDNPYHNFTAIRISRDNGAGYKSIITLSRPDTMQEFKKLCGDGAWNELKSIMNFSSDEQAWSYVQAHPNMGDYGLLGFNISFRHAMGNAYLDREAAGLAVGKQWKYKAYWMDASGNVVESFEGTISGGPSRFTLSPAKQLDSFANDSIAYLRWFIVDGSRPSGLITATVYRQSGGRGGYQKLSNPILGNVKGDSILFYLQDDVSPRSSYRYYIVPMNQVGDEALPSDTVSILSFDFANLPTLQNVEARDSLNSIWVSWAPLQETTHLRGIEIQRSRDIRGNYVVIDTIQAEQFIYRDVKVFPDIPYYYRLRVLGLKGLEREQGYSGYATASLQNETNVPEPPFGLIGTIANNHVQLKWTPVHDADLYAYFVYRSPAGSDAFEVISPALTDTAFSDTTRLSGRTQYAYAIKAVNSNSLQSDFSNIVTMRQAVLDLPVAPTGLHALFDNKKVRLTWPSVTRLDHAIVGYNVYRREQQPITDFNNGLSAAAQASSLQFVLLNKSVITHTSFDDLTAQPFTNYEYAVSAVDAFGAESTYSPFVHVQTHLPARLISNCTVRKITGGIEVMWDASYVTEKSSVNIYRKRAGDATYQRIATLTKRQDRYSDKSVLNNSLYVYVISIENGKDVIARSEEQNIRY